MMATAPEKARSWSRGLDLPKIAVAGLLMLLALGLVAVGLDDVQAHRALPEDTVYARRYMDGMVRVDPIAMWDAFSHDAQQARGCDPKAYGEFIRVGTRAPVDRPNPYHLAARVPLDDGRTLLY